MDRAREQESKRDEIMLLIKEDHDREKKEKTMDYHIAMQAIQSIEKIESVDRQRAYTLRMKLMEINMEAMKTLQYLNI